MKYTGTIVALALLMASCSVQQESKPAAPVPDQSQEVIDLSWHSLPLSLLIQIENIGLHPATGAGLISQVEARVVAVQEGSFPTGKEIVFTISTKDSKEYTIGKQYLLTKGSGGGVIDKKNLVEKPNK